MPSASAETPARTAQRSDATASVPSIPARPEDVGSIDGILRAFYEVVNVDQAAARQWSRDRTLYIPSIRFVGIGKQVTVYDHQALVDATAPMVKSGFHERELRRLVRRYGSAAQVLSSYETRETLVAADGSRSEQTRRGVNASELFFDGARWWITSVVWQSETAELPIPTDLLPA